VKAQSWREAQGSIGRTSRGNAAGEQRTSGGETPEVGATSGECVGFGRCYRTEEGQPREGPDIRCTGQQWRGDGVHLVRRGTLRRVQRLWEMSGCGGNVASRHATRRTPWSVVGCNKPTLSSADETVGVVRNGMDGTA
jgi:hypothetical protein